MRCLAFFLVTERVSFFLRLHWPASRGLGCCFAKRVTASSPPVTPDALRRRPRGRRGVGRGLEHERMRARTTKRMPAAASDAHHNKMCKKLQGRAASQRATRQGKTQGACWRYEYRFCTTLPVVTTRKAASAWLAATPSHSLCLHSLLFLFFL